MNGPWINTIFAARRQALTHALRGIKTLALATACGIPESSIYHLRDGKRKISDLQWMRICKGCRDLGITMLELPNYATNPSPP